MRPAGRIRTILGLRACDCGIQGPESLILSLAQELRGRDVRYVIANLWDGYPPTVALHDEAVRRGLESHVIATSWGLDPRIIPRLLGLVRRLRPDVLHAHEVKGELVSLIVAALTGTPRVASYYGRVTMNSRWLKTWDALGMLGFRFFPRVLANSSSQREELLRWGLPAERVAVVPSFVDTRVLRPPSVAEALAARERLGIAPGRPVLATVARLSVNKGHAHALRALAAVRERVPDVLYLVVGEGDVSWYGDGGYRAELERLAAGLGVADHVRFLGYYPDVRVVLHAADVVVSASLREGMQVSLLEAMATGRPVVATSVGGTPEAVADGETGLLVPPAEPAALAAALLALLADRARRRAMGEAGRRRVEERFDTAVVAERVLGLCEEALGRA